MYLGILETLPEDDPRRIGWTVALRVFEEALARNLAQVFKNKPREGAPQEEFNKWIVDAEISAFNIHATGLIPTINTYDDVDIYMQVLDRFKSAHLQKYENAELSEDTKEEILRQLRHRIDQATFHWKAEALQVARLAAQKAKESSERLPATISTGSSMASVSG